MRTLAPIALVACSLALEACRGCRDDPINPIDQVPANPNDIGAWLSMDVLNGQPAVAYYDKTAGALAFAVGTIGDDSVTWEEERIDGYQDEQTGLDSGDRGQYASLKIANDGTAWISYSDATNGNLFYARRSGKNTWETGFADSGGGPTPHGGRWSSLELDGDGNPVIAHFDLNKQQLRVVRWQDTGFGSAEVVDEGDDWAAPDTATELDDVDANVGRYARLLIQDGVEYLAYYDTAWGHLKLATNDGSGWSVEVVDDGGEAGNDVGKWPSILVDGGTVQIAYQDVTDYALLLATRSGGGDWAIESVDEGSYTGADAELFLNGSYPGIVYFEGEENNIRLATFDGSNWTRDTLGGAQAALGFHNETVVVSGKRYIACYNYTDRDIWFVEL